MVIEIPMDVQAVSHVLVMIQTVEIAVDQKVRFVLQTLIDFALPFSLYFAGIVMPNHLITTALNQDQYAVEQEWILMHVHT